jgi:hypothetical protein
MLNFKEWLLAEEFTSLLTPEKDIITLGQRTPSDLSGFCLHNPQINKFALENATQMFIVFAFVLYTIQREWQVVHHTFPNFMKWVFEEAIHKDDWDYQGTPFANMNILMGGGGKKSKTSAPYLRELWLSKERIFDAIKTLHTGASPTSMMSDSSDYKIFKYILNNVKGLGIVKAAFASQLIIGKFGCIDSVNMRAYRGIIDADIESRGKESSFTKKPRIGKTGVATDLAGNPVFDYEVKKSDRGLVGYVDFLKALEQNYGDDISQVLWNDWCRIVGQKIVKAGSGEKITLSVNGQIEQINPYVPKRHIKDLLDKEKEHLTQFPNPGLGVSQGHLNAIRKASEYMRENAQPINPQEFINRFFASVNAQMNPFGHNYYYTDGQTLVMFKINSSVIKPGGIHIEEIHTIPTKTGAGQRFMEKITRMADETNTWLELNAVPLKTDQRIPLRKLKNFYKSFGFNPLRDSQDTMIRKPKISDQEPS